ncbi:hypothetical protein BHM03_00017942 [Ensete ventricosum]|nr:hypothetical protein BHM03_00017942 [Ensete ventricosum]
MTLVSANTMVTGTVFCDQCKDGERGFFDYLLTGSTTIRAHYWNVLPCFQVSVQCRSCVHDLSNVMLGAKVAVACRGTDGTQTASGEDETNWFGSYSVYFDGSPDLSGCYARVVGGPSGCGAAAGPAQGLTLLFRMFGMAMYVVEPLLSEPQEPAGFCPNAPSLPSPTPTPALPVPPPTPPLPLFEASACPYGYARAAFPGLSYAI